MFTDLKNVFNSVSPISEDDWLMLEPYLKIKEYIKNDYYLSAGDIEDKIGFIRKGSFKWYYINQKGEEVNYHFFFDRNFMVDYLSLITQAPSKLYLQAMEDSTVILLPKRDVILDFYRKSHNWERFGRIIAETVYTETSLRVQDFMFLNAEDRYRNLIKQHPDIFQRVSLANISSYLGVKGPSLSRIRKRIFKQ